MSFLDTLSLVTGVSSFPDGLFRALRQLEVRHVLSNERARETEPGAAKQLSELLTQPRASLMNRRNGDDSLTDDRLDTEKIASVKRNDLPLGRDGLVAVNFSLSARELTDAPSISGPL